MTEHLAISRKSLLEWVAHKPLCGVTGHDYRHNWRDGDEELCDCGLSLFLNHSMRAVVAPARGAQPDMPDWPIPTTHEALNAELVKLRDCFALSAQESRKTDSGTGSWWELGGYADALSDVIDRIGVHRRRVVGIDKQIAKRQQVGAEDALKETP